MRDINSEFVSDKTQINLPGQSEKRPHLLIQGMLWPDREQNLRVFNATANGVVPRSVALGAPMIKPGAMLPRTERS